MVANAPGSVVTGPTTPTPVPVVKQSVPAATPPAPPAVPTPPTAARNLYHAVSPTQAVTIKQLDAALVGYTLPEGTRHARSRRSSATPD